MAQFVPSKKTISDFNSGERYLNKIDVVQAQTVNNLVEGLLFAQENGGSGISELDKQHLDKMWNVWSADGTTDTLVNKVEEVLAAFASFQEGDTIVDLLSKKVDEEKLADVAFTGRYSDLVGVPDTGVYSVNGQTGRVWIDKDSLGLADISVTGSFLDLVDASEHCVTSVNGERGDLIIDRDFLGLAEIAYTGNYRDLIGAPDSGVISVNGQTGKVWIDKDSLGLADVAISGSFLDLVDAPESGVLSVNGQTGNVILTADLLGVVSFLTEQNISETWKEQARTNIGAGTSDFSGSYSDLLNKPDLNNYVTLDTKQTITGAKMFGDGTGNAYTQIIMKSYSGGSPATEYGLVVKTKTSSATYQSDQIIKDNGTQSYNYIFPNKSGTLAITRDIPSISVTNSGSGNVVTGISASGHTITVTKGSVSSGVTYNDIYPVGSIYMSISSTSPSSLFGGSWTELGYGTFLMASGGGSAGSSGGSSSHSHSLGTPNNTEAMALVQANVYSAGTGVGFLPTDYYSWEPKEAILSGTYNNSADYGTRSGATQVVGNTKSESNLPPYYTVHIWRRTA